MNVVAQQHEIDAHRQGDLAAKAQVEALPEAMQTRRYVEGARN
jgi:hypothetical protein